MMIQFRIIFSIGITGSLNKIRGDIMNKARTTFNNYEYDRRCKLSIKDAERLAYTTEDYSTKNLLNMFMENRELIRKVNY